MEKAGANSASEVDVFLCTYKAIKTEGSRSYSVNVVTAGAVCTTGTDDCEVFAVYDNQACSQASICPDTDKPSISADCSGISSSYFSCQLECDPDQPGYASGMDTCLTSEGPSEGPAPSPLTSAAMSNVGAGLVLSGLLTLASVTVF